MSEEKTHQEKFMNELHEQASKFIAKHISIFNNEPSYAQVLQYVCVPLVADYCHQFKWRQTLEAELKDAKKEIERLRLEYETTEAQ